jgi:hypothetical protein
MITLRRFLFTRKRRKDKRGEKEKKTRLRSDLDIVLTNAPGLQSEIEEECPYSTQLISH